MSTSRTVLVTGAAGQDGSYLCEQLLSEGADVHALRLPGNATTGGPSGWASRCTWHEGDVADAAGIRELVLDVAPDEIYNLAGISSVALSWEQPVLTGLITGIGAAAVYDAAWHLQESSGRVVRVLQASSAEIFGSPAVAPQDESTPLAPTSPYGAAKAYAHHLAAAYRARGLGIATTILYNHESPRRPEQFVTRKVTRTAAAISLGLADELVLGNLDAERDWGWAPDFVDAMVRANRAEEADDYVIATGVAHSVRDFVAASFVAAGVTDWAQYVRTDPALLRPADPVAMLGDPSKARAALGWAPTLDFDGLVAAMVEADVATLGTDDETWH